MARGGFRPVLKLRRAFGIPSSGTVQLWVRLYGDKSLLPEKVKVETMKEPEKLEGGAQKDPRRGIQELEAALSDARATGGRTGFPATHRHACARRCRRTTPHPRLFLSCNGGLWLDRRFEARPGVGSVARCYWTGSMARGAIGHPARRPRSQGIGDPAQREPTGTFLCRVSNPCSGASGRSPHPTLEIQQGVTHSSPDHHHPQVSRVFFPAAWCWPFSLHPTRHTLIISSPPSAPLASCCLCMNLPTISCPHPTPAHPQQKQAPTAAKGEPAPLNRRHRRPYPKIASPNRSR